jgi:mono/diheme cytochrome c family protein
MIQISRMTRRALGSVLLAGSSILLLCAAAGSRWDRVPAKDHARTSPLAGSADAVQAGAFVYRDHCASCHKGDALGDGHKKPALRSDRIRNATDGDIEWFLRQGDLAHGMPSWSSLPEAQRWQLIAYLRSIQ